MVAYYSPLYHCTYLCLYLTLNWYEYFSLGTTQNNCCPNTEGCAETTSPLVCIPELTGSELVCGVKTLLFSLIFCQPVCSPPPLPLLPSLPLPLSYPSSLLPSPFPAFPPTVLKEHSITNISRAESDDCPASPADVNGTVMTFSTPVNKQPYNRQSVCRLEESILC